jgi:hypothetical protein
MKFYENPSNGSRVVPCGRTDRHDKANSRVSQFCEKCLKTKAGSVIPQNEDAVRWYNNYVS